MAVVLVGVVVVHVDEDAALSSVQDGVVLLVQLRWHAGLAQGHLSVVAADAQADLARSRVLLCVYVWVGGRAKREMKGGVEERRGRGSELKNGKTRKAEPWPQRGSLG